MFKNSFYPIWNDICKTHSKCETHYAKAAPIKHVLYNTANNGISRTTQVDWAHCRGMWVKKEECVWNTIPVIVAIKPIFSNVWN